MRILVNTISTKKHSGGAYQIAYNFLLKTIEHPEIDWVYVVSTDLDEILPESLKKDKNYYVFPTQPDFKHSYWRVKKELAELEKRLQPDVVYSVTAPSYFTFKTPEVMRFTNPWVTHPNKYAWSVLSWKANIEMRLYCWIQRRLIKNAHYFITQSETTRKGILRITGVPPENVKVVSNVLPAIFNALPSTSLPPDEQWIDIACVANSSVHKNLDILPNVLNDLKKLGVNNARFHVTIPTTSNLWENLRFTLESQNMKDRAITHGRLSQTELADLYRNCQFCFLPTLLEVFSASTVEAMYFQLPIVATDFDFNREVMNDSCLYYEPKNAKAAAEQFVKLFKNIDLQKELKEKMKVRLSLYSDYDAHFNSILDFITQVANHTI